MPETSLNISSFYAVRFPPGGNAEGADHSLQSIVEVKNGGANLRVFMALCSIKYRDNFSLSFTFKVSCLKYDAPFSMIKQIMGLI
jgi:hypothetical protein